VARCHGESNRPQNYRDRGITVCLEWRNDFMKFYEWALSNGYSDELQIDRRNNDGNYEPGNCRWVTAKVNANNRRNSRNKIIQDATSN
jgi:hypothetical protein